MKKLEVAKYAEIVSETSIEWEVLHTYNLLYYYVFDNYLYIYSRVTKKTTLYLFDSEEEKETIKKRVDTIEKEMEKSKVNIRNYYDIKKQSIAMHNNKCNNSEIKKGVFRKDTFFKGFFIECFNQYEQRDFNEFFNVFLSGYVLKSKWPYDFKKYRELRTLALQWNRDDLLIMDNDAGEIVNNLEAVSRIKKGVDIEIGYSNNSSDLVFFSYWYYLDGDILSVDDFVYSEDSESLIDSTSAVWCEDVQDYRHIDEIFEDFHGNIFGSDEELIYSEEKNYYILETSAVRVYSEDCVDYFWAHCDDLDDYYFWESDDEYHDTPEEEGGLIKSYGKTRLPKHNKGSKPYFIGIELEMEKDNTHKKEREEDILEILNTEYYDNLLEWKEDGSLVDGVEMVTAPISLEIFKKEIVPVIQNLQKKGFTSEKGGRCGMHVHISRNVFSEEAQARLILIYAKFENIIKILSRRNGNTHYCADVLNTVNAVSLDNAEEVVQNQKSKSKSTAINFNNSETIEFRVFRGTMNTDTLIANIQLVQLIADLSLTDMSVQDILNLTFNNLVQKMQEDNYQELFKYCAKKGLLD